VPDVLGQDAAQVTLAEDEHPAAVADEVPEPVGVLAEVHQEVAGRLRGPGAVGVGRGAQYVDVAATGPALRTRACLTSLWHTEQSMSPSCFGHNGRCCSYHPTP